MVDESLKGHPYWKMFVSRIPESVTTRCSFFVAQNRQSERRREWWSEREMGIGGDALREIFDQGIEERERSWEFVRVCDILG
jgi:hypothetical protein